MPEPTDIDRLADIWASSTSTRGGWIAFDTEFIEDGRTIDLLSIGLVRYDGTTYYAEPAETDRTRASEWVVENVMPHLTGPVKPRALYESRDTGDVYPAQSVQDLMTDIRAALDGSEAP